MAPPKGKASVRKQQRPVKEDRKLKRKREIESIEALQKAVDEIDPKALPTKFTDLPLSKPTLAGLRDSHFETLTDIQARAVPAAMRGVDILGAAKTGSGKTLAFIVPVLEKLYRARWTEYDGLGALIMSPTRELSAQIFEVLRKVGRHHGFSAGLVIGGKNLQEEADRIGRMNILVCTPGRMLQHLDQTANLDINNLQILVLDEADRIMDMGFQSAVDALVEHLPPSRQTLLFSATQSRRVSDLARLSLKEPEYIAVHEAATAATPSQLQQHYVITPLPDKLDTLYGFIRSNLKSKMIVFFSSGKQVRFAYETFRQMQPGIPLLHLHGRQKQLARLEIIKRFTSAKHSCLFATDVVARGVDIPMVDWVVQVDCPEDADTYIHRSGRTARYESAGKAILFLDPSEEAGMVKRLEQKKVPIKKVNVREKKKASIRDQIQNMCFQQHDIKYLAQKAFVSYTRSVFLQKDKEVFNLDALDLDGFAKSLGLAGAPQIRFRKGEDLKKYKNASRAMLSSGDESESGDEGGKKKKGEVRTKAQRMFERTNQDVLTKHYQDLIGNEGSEDEQDKEDDDVEVVGGDKTSILATAAGAGTAGDDADFFSAKRVMDDEALTHAAGLKGAQGSQSAAAETENFTTAKVLKLGGEKELIIDSKRREKLLKSKKQLLRFKGTSTKLVFDDDGVARPIYELHDESDFEKQGPAEEQRKQFVDIEADRVRRADAGDKALVKEKRREKKYKRKARERAEALGEAAEENGGGAAGSDEDDGGVHVVGDGRFGDDGDDGLALLRSLPIAGGHSDDDDDSAPPKKKQKKWFQTDNSDSESDGAKKKGKKSKKDKGKQKVFEMDALPENLEDLEALATGLLDN